MGGDVLCGWDLLRIVAFWVWTLVVRGKVGHHAGADRAKALGIRLLLHRCWIHGCGLRDHVFVPDHTPTALWADGRKRFVYYALICPR